MSQNKKILDEFEAEVIATVANAPKCGVPLADVIRPYLASAPMYSLRYRVSRLERQKRIRIKDLAGRKLLLPVEEEENECK